MNGKAFQSKLRPFADFISESRKSKKSWSRIALDLEQKGCVISADAISVWYRRYAARPETKHAPFLKEILSMRNIDGMTWKAIKEELLSRGLKTDEGSLCRFVKNHEKKALSKHPQFSFMKTNL